MENKTYVFKSNKTYERVLNALNDTYYTFTAYERLQIKLYGAAAIADMDAVLNEA